MQIYCLTNFEVVFLNVFFQFLNWLMKGCDGSILISSKPGSKMLSEKDAQDNKDLRVEGFQIITKAKALVESKCPGVVSCADILAIAARDFVHLVSVSFLFTSLVLSAYISNAYISDTVILVMLVVTNMVPLYVSLTHNSELV